MSVMLCDCSLYMDMSMNNSCVVCCMFVKGVLNEIMLLFVSVGVLLEGPCSVSQSMGLCWVCDPNIILGVPSIYCVCVCICQR